jgi:DNA-binding NarL/FixJ family response regulator
MDQRKIPKDVAAAAAVRLPAADERRALDELTSAEREILRLVVAGRRNAEVAATLGLSPRTVETYRGRLMRKLHLRDLPTLVKLALRHGLTTLDG